MAKRAPLRTIAATLAGTMLAFVLTAAPAAAATQSSHAAFDRVKAALDVSPGLTHVVTVSGNTRTTTYSRAGIKVVSLAVPVRTGGIQPRIAVNGCGWFLVCVWFNRSDQYLLQAGYVAFIGSIICILGPPLCPFASAAAGAAGVYVTNHAMCRNYLVLTLFPWPGTLVGCY